MKLKSISVFYRNDRPNGVGISVLNPDASALHEFIEAADRDWHEADDKAGYAEELTANLAMVGTMSDRKKKEHFFHVLGALHLLVKHGYVREDDFNGILYQYEATRRTA